MKFRNLAQLLMLVVLTLGATLLNAQAPEKVQPRIIGGVNFSEPYPWMTSISLHNDLPHPDCGGTLIAPQWVLTAAHCVVNAQSSRVVDTSLITVNIGETVLNTATGDEVKTISQVRVHQSYSSSTLANDIALLKLSSSSSKSAIALATLTVPKVNIGQNMRTMGWGRTSNSSQVQPNTLQEVDIPLVSQQTCINAYTNTGHPINSTQLCAGLVSGGKDACAGDSGGPIIAKHNSVWYQVGVTSFGKDLCAARDSYGVYTRVTSFRAWIDCAKAGTCGITSGNLISTGTVTTPAQFNLFQFFLDVLTFIFNIFFPPVAA